jgi:hypothetical protein
MTISFDLLAGRIPAEPFAALRWEQDPDGSAILCAASRIVPYRLYLLNRETETGEAEVIVLYARSLRHISYGEGRMIPHKVLVSAPDVATAIRAVHEEEYAFYVGSVHGWVSTDPAPPFEQVWSRIGRDALSGLAAARLRR